VQLRKQGIVHYQVDYRGWSLRELTSLRLYQDDMNLILGGNAARIFLSTALHPAVQAAVRARRPPPFGRRRSPQLAYAERPD
jgi:hypothetical protein